MTLRQVIERARVDADKFLALTGGDPYEPWAIDSTALELWAAFVSDSGMEEEEADGFFLAYDRRLSAETRDR